MKQTLQIKLGQQLTMTPQLQQAIRLLQLSTLELQTEIQSALESNPLLELQEEAHDTTSHETIVATSTDSVTQEIADNRAETPWESQYVSSSNYSGSDDSSDYLSHLSDKTDTLQDHLLWQLRLSPFSHKDQVIACNIIDSLGEDGYLRCTTEEILSNLPDELEIELDEIEAVIHRIQHFDPVGIASRTLKECLIAQINVMPDGTPFLDETKLLISKHFEMLGHKQYSQLLKKVQFDEDTLKGCINLIQTLNPKPGSHISSSEPDYVIPDVVVHKISGKWQVELNPDAIPRLRINGQYAGMIKRADNSSDNTYLKGQLQEARWLLKSLESRNETLLKVANCIVEHQVGFLESGEEAMRPLVLHDVAQAISMHESTVSRVTTQKFIHTPRGVFELKYFFSSHVNTQSGGECSSIAIRAFIKRLIADENPQKPLSDNKIALLLQEQGIQVARRTVAKYREALNIPSSNERKQHLRS